MLTSLGCAKRKLLHCVFFKKLIHAVYWCYPIVISNLISLLQLLLYALNYRDIIISVKNIINGTIIVVA